MAWYDAALAHLRPPFESLCVETRYGSTHVIQTHPHRTNAYPLVLLHGINTNAAVWTPQINRLSQRLIVPDVPGFAGKSDPTRIPYTGSAFADWLADVLDALNIERAVLAGGSAGGWFALKFAAYHPSRTAALLLMNPVGIAPYRHVYKLTQRQWLVRLAHLARPFVANRPAARRVVERGMKHTASADNVEMAYLLLRYFKRRAAPPLMPAAELERVQAPVTLLVSQGEIYTNPYAVIMRAQQQLPHLADAKWLPDVGHDINKEAPERVNALLRTLAQQAPTPNTPLRTAPGDLLLRPS